MILKSLFFHFVCVSVIEPQPQEVLRTSAGLAHRYIGAEKRRYVLRIHLNLSYIA